MSFRIKVVIAWFMNLFGILNCMISQMNKNYDNNYIRIINYHGTQQKDKKKFIKQLQYFKKNFTNINYEQFKKFLITGLIDNDKSKPGLMLTFDDGIANNYYVAKPLLEEYGFTGYFMCSSDLIGTEGYMSYDQLRDLISNGHIITDHSATHHRMNEDDTEQLLDYEIRESKDKLENELHIPIEIYTWCGGEENHYTKKAYKKIIESGYKYGFMTNSKPVVKGDNPFNIQRINVEAGWPLYLLKFQISGMMDRRFKAKRIRVDKKLEVL